jgi:hypothetical protein
MKKQIYNYYTRKFIRIKNISIYLNRALRDLSNNKEKHLFEKNAEFNVLSNCDMPNVRALGQNKINSSN